MKARDVPNGLQVRYEGALYTVCHVSHGIEGEIPYLSGGTKLFTLDPDTEVEIPLYMVFDVESVGLYGGAYAVGWVVIDGMGKELDFGAVHTPYENLPGTPGAFKWLEENTTPLESFCVGTSRKVRDVFWDAWMRWKAQGALLVADCPFPVEAKFLTACVDDVPEEREWLGPYPLLDVASCRMIAGFNPLGSEERLAGELPVHDPLADARQSARLFLEALNF